MQCNVSTPGHRVIFFVFAFPVVFCQARLAPYFYDQLLGYVTEPEWRSSHLYRSSLRYFFTPNKNSRSGGIGEFALLADGIRRFLGPVGGTDTEKKNTTSVDGLLRRAWQRIRQVPELREGIAKYAQLLEVQPFLSITNDVARDLWHYSFQVPFADFRLLAAGVRASLPPRAQEFRWQCCIQNGEARAFAAKTLLEDPTKRRRALDIAVRDGAANIFLPPRGSVRPSLARFCKNFGAPETDLEFAVLNYACDEEPAGFFGFLFPALHADAFALFYPNDSPQVDNREVQAYASTNATSATSAVKTPFALPVNSYEEGYVRESVFPASVNSKAPPGALARYEPQLHRLHGVTNFATVGAAEAQIIGPTRKVKLFSTIPVGTRLHRDFGPHSDLRVQVFQFLHAFAELGHQQVAVASQYFNFFPGDAEPRDATPSVYYRGKGRDDAAPLLDVESVKKRRAVLHSSHYADRPKEPLHRWAPLVGRWKPAYSEVLEQRKKLTYGTLPCDQRYILQAWSDILRAGRRREASKTHELPSSSEQKKWQLEASSALAIEYVLVVLNTIMLQKTKRQFDSFINMGANDGWHEDPFPSLFFDRQQEIRLALAVEANPRDCQRHKRNWPRIPVLCSSVTPENVGQRVLSAILAAEGYYGPRKNDTTLSQEKVAARRTLRKSRGLPVVDIVKIDIDSFDCDVLQALLQTVLQQRPAPGNMYTETNMGSHPRVLKELPPLPSLILTEVYDGVPPPFRFSQKWTRAGRSDETRTKSELRDSSDHIFPGAASSSFSSPYTAENLEEFYQFDGRARSGGSMPKPWGCSLSYQARMLRGFQYELIWYSVGNAVFASPQWLDAVQWPDRGGLNELDCALTTPVVSMWPSGDQIRHWMLAAEDPGSVAESIRMAIRQNWKRTHGETSALDFVVEA
ncbi:unnamed protein product [Amoebophrya sp. A120]|nr:unnamed protein product [Amoebophrya sp. A120]|eukprot:GSA120T00017890001.1